LAAFVAAAFLAAFVAAAFGAAFFSRGGTMAVLVPRVVSLPSAAAIPLC
jgi:hypothetical protein